MGLFRLVYLLGFADDESRALFLERPARSSFLARPFAVVFDSSHNFSFKSASFLFLRILIVLLFSNFRRMAAYLKGLKPLPPDFAVTVMDLEMTIETGKFTYDGVNK
jgi:hypothetical protein